MGMAIITAVLNAHREGLLAKASIESLKRNVVQARKSGLEVEVLVILDRADEITRKVIKLTCDDDFRLIETNFGDAGNARNFAVESARGEYIAFLDADDLWGDNWLVHAAKIATQREDEVIWHPEVCIYFGTTKHLFVHIDMEDSSFNSLGLAVENYWTSLSFGARAIYLKNPYPATDLSSGFGFEDWAWNMETITRGVIHKIVLDTGHIIRRKEDSVSTATVRARGIVRPNNYIRNIITRASPFNASGT